MIRYTADENLSNGESKDVAQCNPDIIGIGADIFVDNTKQRCYKSKDSNALS